MTDQAGGPSEEEIRAALEEELRRVRVQDLVLQSVVGFINVGARRTGLAGASEEERDLEQARLAIDAVRALVPLVERAEPAQAAAVRDALSQLQLAYVRAGGKGTPATTHEPDPAPPPGAGGEAARGAPAPGTQRESGGPGPAQRSGKLWVPGG